MDSLKIKSLLGNDSLVVSYSDSYNQIHIAIVGPKCVDIVYLTKEDVKQLIPYLQACIKEIEE